MSEGYNPLRLLTRGLEVAVGRLPRPFLDYPEHEPPSDRAWRVREPPSDCTWSIRSSALTSSFGCVRPRPREARRWRSSCAPGRSEVVMSSGRLCVVDRASQAP